MEPPLKIIRVFKWDFSVVILYFVNVYISIDMKYKEIFINLRPTQSTLRSLRRLEFCFLTRSLPLYLYTFNKLKEYLYPIVSNSKIIVYVIYLHVLGILYINKCLRISKENTEPL